MEAQSRFLLFQAELPKPIRRAIWIVGQAGIVLCYVALGMVGVYGLALCVATDDLRYSFITGIVIAAFIYIRFLDEGPMLDEENSDEDITQPLTPTA